MAIGTQQAGSTPAELNALRRFIIWNLADDRLVARRILLAVARGELREDTDADYLKYIFRPANYLGVLAYLAVYLLATRGRLPDRAAIPRLMALDSVYDPLSRWMIACLVEGNNSLPPVNNHQGMALVDTVLDGAVAHLRSVQMLDDADTVSILRSSFDEAWRDSGGTWVLAASFSSHIGHFAYAAALLTLQSAGRLTGPPIAMQRGPSRNKFLAQKFDARFCDSVPPDAGYVDLMSGTKRYRTTAGRLASISDVVSMAASLWGRGQPFLTLDPETRARGDAALAGIRIPPDAPLVTLHVRTAGYNLAIGNMMRLRDADIATYEEAVKLLTDLGIYVVRLGDRTMEGAPNWERFVDYPFSTVKSDWMDIYLAARCRFHIGTSSGMSFIPLLHGRPVVFTNWPTLSQIVCAPNVVTLPKVLLDERGAVVPFEAFCGAHREILEASDASLHGLSFRDNTPAELAEAVDLMLAHYDEDLGGPEFPAGMFDAVQAVTSVSALRTRPQIPPAFFARTYGCPGY
jgi:putative glycosyltransferase (TIGR04372 family)